MASTRFRGGENAQHTQDHAGSAGAACLDALVLRCGSLSVDAGIEFAQHCQQVFSAVETELLAKKRRQGASERSTRAAAAAGGTRSKRAASAAARRADAANENPDLVGALASGDLGEEQLNAIAAVSAKTDGEAARDEGLVDRVRLAPVGKASAITTEWLENRDGEHSAKSRYDRQRRRRKIVWRYDPVSQCETATIYGDRESMAQIRASIRANRDAEYRRDGGRDIPGDQHTKTRDQREYDAAHRLLTGAAAATERQTTAPAAADSTEQQTTAPAAADSTQRQPSAPAAADSTEQQTTAPATDHGQRRGWTSAEPDAGTSRAPSTPPEPAVHNDPAIQQRAATPSTPVRPVIHVRVTADPEDEGAIRASMAGGDGLLPDHVVARWMCNTIVTGTVFSTKGLVLWHGREKRYATPDQVNALIARDGGCVVCAEHPSRCVAHHLNPVNAPVRGKTNIDELALVCDDCHHDIHDRRLTLYWKLGPPDPATGLPGLIWRARPATPNEIPIDRRNSAA